MNIYKNPFYILDATPIENRHILAAKIDSRALLVGDSASDAYNMLTNPARRLSAEFEWFPGISEDKVAEIIAYLKNLQEDPNTDDLVLGCNAPLAQLEFALAKVHILGFSGVLEAKRAVLELSRLFGEVKLTAVMDDINRNRELARFPKLQDTQALEEEFGHFRQEIKDTLSLLFSHFPEREYISAVSMIAEKYIADDVRYRDSVVIEDLVDTYALKMTSSLQEEKATIIEDVGRIEQRALDMQIDRSIAELSEKLREWNEMAQPLQYLAKGQGKRHFDSEKIVYAVRGLCLKLHNDYQMTDKALSLTEVLDQHFSELPQVADTLRQDLDTLKKLQEAIRKRKEAEAEKLADEAKEERRRGESKQYINRPISLFWAAAFVIVIAVCFVLCAIPHKSQNSSPSTPPAADQPTKPPASTESGSVDTQPSHRESSVLRREALEQAMDELDRNIKEMEEELTDLLSDIEYYEEQYYATYDEDYANWHDEAVDEYNDIFEDYQQAIDDYNEMVDEYNSLLS